MFTLSFTWRLAHCCGVRWAEVEGTMKYSQPTAATLLRWEDNFYLQRLKRASLRLVCVAGFWIMHRAGNQHFLAYPRWPIFFPAGKIKSLPRITNLTPSLPKCKLIYFGVKLNLVLTFTWSNLGPFLNLDTFNMQLVFINKNLQITIGFWIMCSVFLATVKKVQIKLERTVKWKVCELVNTIPTLNSFGCVSTFTIILLYYHAHKTSMICVILSPQSNMKCPLFQQIANQALLIECITCLPGKNFMGFPPCWPLTKHNALNF